jgi:Domain of unknown function (DUF4382)
MRRPKLLLSSLLVACVLTACRFDSTDTATPTPGSGLTIDLTDAPVDDALEVVVVFTGIEVQPEAGGPPIVIDLPSPKSIDLLKYRNGATANLVAGANVPAGRYLWLRLMLRAEQNLQSGSYIRLLDGRQFPLYIPSGSETGLKLVRGFTVAQGAITKLLIDFDLRKSLVAPPGQQPNWFLKPALRLIDELQVGTVSGTVDLSALATATGATTATCKAGIYVFNGANATPDDMDGKASDGADPIAYFPVTPAAGGSTATYSIPLLEVGAYTIAATCQFDVDADPSVSEYDPTATAPAPGAPTPPGYQTMKFATRNASITNGGTTTVNLP